MNEESKKAYDFWNDKKKAVEASDRFRSIYFRQGDIWWCHIGKNIGTESYGKGIDFRRPILVLKKLSNETCIAIPISTQKKDGTWFVEITFQQEKRWALLYQIRMLHSKRFTIKMGELDETDFLLVKEKLAALLELSCVSSPENRHPDESRIDGISPKTSTAYPESKNPTSDLKNTCGKG